ncbi:ChaN family lipoprotein [Rudaea sp.]|uniref:ChaN family lipoprotein n=1 Tax=Rudaea sp. TaxID=2136325 RepID=UPI002ED29F20
MGRLACCLLALALPLSSTIAHAEGSVVHHAAFASKFVKPRDVSVWLPEGYDPKGERLPVLYMQDGENLYDSSRSLSGANWGVDVTVSRLIREGKMPRVIVVGMASTDLRGREYLPKKIYDRLPAATRVAIATGWGGEPLSDEYLKFIVRELKPFIDRSYHTKAGAADTYVMGSSMGGLISFYAQAEYPQVFGASASLSLHWLLGSSRDQRPDSAIHAPQVSKAFADYLDGSALKPAGHRVYIDQGTATLDASYRPYSLAFEDLMRARGWTRGGDFESRVFAGENHSEAAWNKRLATPLEFLFSQRTKLAAAPRAHADAEYLDFLRRAQVPDDYMVGKFGTADVVLLGEDHAVRQNLAFVAALIPKLYAAGVRNLVMEFGAQEDQQALDALLGAATFDEGKAKALMFHYNSMWSWKEYRDLYRAAWTFNRALAPGRKPFRIVNMSYVYDWRGFDGVRTPRSLARIFSRGVVDAFRADLISRDILDRGEKALVLTGTLHAFTHFAMPETHADSDGFCLRTENALGNRLLKAYGMRVANVLLHQSLPNRPGVKPAFVQPGGGEIERLMRLNANVPVGFDLRGTPLGDVREPGYYGLCDDKLTLGGFFDGYVFLAPFWQLEAATPDPDFVDEINLRSALDQFPDPDWSPKPADLKGIKADLQKMADDIDRRYRAAE